jgi:hypothetical protein
MVDLRWKFMPQGGLEYTIQFRLSPDEEPIVSKTLFISADPPALTDDPLAWADKVMQSLVDQVLNKTVGGTRDRPPQIVPLDF